MPTLSFVVPLAPKGTTPMVYLARASEYAETNLPDEAIRFVLNTATTPLQQLGIEMRAHELAGGLDKYLDLTTGVERVRVAFFRDVERHLWPEGKPDAETDDEKRRQDEAIDAAATAADTPLKRQLVALRDLEERIAFLAWWPDVVVDPPEGWETLHNKTLPPNVVGWIQAAYRKAAEENEEGKQQPSA